MASHRAPLETRYYHFDQQGIAFNMWFLAYFEDGRNALFEAAGYPLRQLHADSYDIQLVHSSIDWSRPLRYSESAAVDVAVERIGSTSLTLAFTVLANEIVVAVGRTVYVVVASGSWTKAEVPQGMRRALERRLAVTP